MDSTAFGEIRNSEEGREEIRLHAEETRMDAVNSFLEEKKEIDELELLGLDDDYEDNEEITEDNV